MPSDSIALFNSSSQSVEDLNSTWETGNEKSPHKVKTSNHNQIGFVQYSLQANDHDIRSALCLSNVLRGKADAKPQQIFKHRLKTVYRVALEFAFQMTNYPSRADKVLLAKDCGMTYKQINNWFQNRRDRPEMAFEYSVPTTVDALRDVLYALLDQSIARSKVYGNKSPAAIGTLEETALKDEQKTERRDESPISPIAEIDTKISEDIPQKRGIAITHIEDIFAFPKPEWRRRPAGLPCQQTCSSSNVDRVVSKFNSMGLSTAGDAIPSSLTSVAVVNRPVKKLPLRTSRFLSGRTKPANSATGSQIANLSDDRATSFSTVIEPLETSHSLVTRNIRPLPCRRWNSRAGKGTQAPAR
ncbi:hypothetical protein BU17DRAFT_92961 [Hysterangium stoloniferum]|nr:hypothetical protein BU17DRAFT_92961 [Hysterangium stoloniferum]